MKMEICLTDGVHFHQQDFVHTENYRISRTEIPFEQSLGTAYFCKGNFVVRVHNNVYCKAIVFRGNDSYGSRCLPHNS